VDPLFGSVLGVAFALALSDFETVVESLCQVAAIHFSGRVKRLGRYQVWLVGHSENHAVAHGRFVGHVKLHHFGMHLVQHTAKIIFYLKTQIHHCRIFSQHLLLIFY